MKRYRSGCAYALALSVAVAGCAVVSGCGGDSGKPEMVKPAQPPSVTSKDSMQNYKDNMPKKGAKAK